MNISNIHSCYGCGVCAIACGKKIIDIHLNNEGFYEPQLTDVSKCTDCGLCVEVCSFSHNETVLREKPKVAYGAWSKDADVRCNSASGGVGFEIGKFLLSQGYKVVAVRYNVSHKRAEHYVANSLDEFNASKGSKYIQSYTLEGLRGINRKEKFLVTGTPCQIDSFRRYIRRFRCEENFVLMDFFCHGVPSAHVWNKYISEVEKHIGGIKNVVWRNKLYGWHDSWMMAIHGIEENSVINSRWTQGDTFYNMFLGNNCLGKACYKSCKFKYNHSSADIRIGDMWGDTYKDNENGVTATVAFTDKGVEVLKHCNCIFEEYSFQQVAEGQIEKPIPYPGIGWNVVIALSKVKMVPMSTLVFVSKVIGKVNRIIKRQS